MLLLCLALLALATTSGGVAAAPQPACAAVVVDPAASALAQLAGRELRRYIWHVTATLAPIYRAVSDVPPGCRRLVLAEAPEQLGGVAADADAAARVAALQPSEHLILSQRGDPLTVVIAGGDGQGALYAAYLFAHEVLGVHFSLAGDVLPAPARAAAAQNNNASSWGSIDLLDTPRFPLRGLQPFYNFAEGPDWWSEDHWRSVLAQAAKMRMNMVAIHTYSPSRSIGTTNYSSTGPVRGQPQLWVGTPGNVTADGNVTAEGAYGADWASTAVGSFSIQDGRGTSGYPWGGALAFANDCHANPEVFEGSRCNDDTRYAANDDDAAAYVPVFAAGLFLDVDNGDLAGKAKTRSFWSTIHSTIQMIILPRQARDKHRGDTFKQEPDTRLCTGSAHVRPAAWLPAADCRVRLGAGAAARLSCRERRTRGDAHAVSSSHGRLDARPASECLRPGVGWCETKVFCPVFLESDRFTKTGSG